MNDQGFVCLPSFCSTDAIKELMASILELERLGTGFYSTEKNNVFLEEVDCSSNAGADDLPKSSSP